MASVLLEGVSKVFPGGVAAVEQFDLRVDDFELVVLVGPSGCGKSTTLRMIAGLEEVSQGTISIGDRVVNDVSPKDRDIAMVFQNYALYPHMNVYRNMAFGLELRYGGGWLGRFWTRLVQPTRAAELGRQRKSIRGKVGEAADLLGIGNLLDRMPRQLSGGERQRVALGRAIVRQPAVFLFDEPLSNLDAKLRTQMRGEIKRLHRHLEATMIYVTHDQVEALTLGQRIVVMDGGRIQQVGPPMEVYDRPKSRFVAGFLGSPPMNFVAGRLRQSDGRMRFEGNGVEMTLDDALVARMSSRATREVVLGIRPEDVSVIPAEEREDYEHKGCRARVTTVESLGDSTIVHLEIGPATDAKNHLPVALQGKARARSTVQPGDVVDVGFAAERLHLFDPQSGDNLTLASTQ